MRRNCARTTGSGRMPDEILLWDDRIRVEVRREQRKHVRLYFRADGTLDARAPEGVDIRSVLKSRRRWLEGRVAALAEAISGEGGCDDMLLLRGRPYLIRQSDICRLPMEGTDEVCYSSPAALGDLLKRELRNELGRLSEDYCRRMGVRCHRIVIRNQRTRWGSCSNKKNLNFNLILIALPPALCEYVVIHEIAHLAERGHSGRFWRLVALHCSDYRRRERELQQYWFRIERNRVWQTLRTIGRGSRPQL